VKAILATLALAIALAQPSRAAGPLAPVAVVVGLGGAAGTAALTFYWLRPTWRCWSDLDENGKVLTNYCSTMPRFRADDEHCVAGPNFKNKAKCERICLPPNQTTGFDEIDEPDFTLTLETATDIDSAEWTELGNLETGVDSEFPQLTIEPDWTEPKRFYRVRVDLVEAALTKGKP
jgi:hypothetical protein